MIIISRKELKKFLHHSSKIKSRGILNVLDSVRIDCFGEQATITKTNIHQFLVCDVDADWKNDISFLVEESTLNNISQYGGDDFVTIRIKGNTIYLESGKKVYTCPVQDVTTFPTIQKPQSKEKYEIPVEEISFLQSAKIHILPPDQQTSWKNLVQYKKMGKKKYIVASDGFIMYSQEIQIEKPDISLEPEVISFLEGSPGANYIDGDKYGYFETGEKLFGFVKSELKCADLSVFYDSFNFDKTFEISKKELEIFCKSASAMSHGSESISITDAGENKLNLDFVDLAGDKTIKEEFSVSQKGFELEPTNILPKQLATLLRGVSGECLKMSKCGSMFIIKSDDDEGYVGVIQQVAPVN